MKKKFTLSQISEINIEINKWDIIFLNWDLAAWKTTLSKYLINDVLNIDDDVISPTYTYYNKYWKNIYHFDLYRLSNYDEFVQIWWEEILDNPDNICIIEWPDILREYFEPMKDIYLEKTENDNERIIKF